MRIKHIVEWQREIRTAGGDRGTAWHIYCQECKTHESVYVWESYPPHMRADARVDAEYLADTHAVEHSALPWADESINRAARERSRGLFTRLFEAQDAFRKDQRLANQNRKQHCQQTSKDSTQR